MAGANTKTNPGKAHEDVRGLIHGFTQDPPENIQSLGVSGTSYTIPEILVKLAGIEVLYAKAEEAEIVRASAVQARDEHQQENEAFARNTRRAIKSALGVHNPRLRNYNIEPEKAPTPLTAEAAVTKKEKGAATRKLRNTMGPKQKAKIKAPATTTSSTPSSKE